ncbi:MAG TPA: right-handed parallel beta-helix repeat-containing protein [Thermoleophilaceae bacterium]|jgi:hypothetical protein
MRRRPLPLWRLLPAATAAAIAAAVGLSVAGPASGSAACDKVASPSGSDSAAGTAAAPYRTLQKLTTSLSAGQTGCLRAGSYGGDQVWLDPPHSTLRSYPGERATITAFLEVSPGATGSHVEQLRFDSVHNGNDVGVKIQAPNAVFAGNEVTKGGHGICVVAGSTGAPRGITIERNHIHDCGPSNSKWDHQLYMVHTRRAVIRWNVLEGNAGGWGVHLYTDADGTLIEHNVIDGNRGGVIFAGDDGEHSDDNVVRNNAITYSGPRWNIESSWSGGPSGNGNVASDNCLRTRGPDGPAGVSEQDGFRSRSEIVLSSDPYVDRARGDWHFRPDSPCARLVGDVASAVGLGHSGRPRAYAASLRILLRAHRSHGPKVGVRGRVTGGHLRRGSRVRLQVRGRHGWRTVARRRVKHGRFSARVRVHRGRRTRTVRLRAVLPKRARSRAVRVLVRP